TRVGIEEKSRGAARVEERTRTGATDRAMRDTARTVRENARMTRENPRMTRENSRMTRDNARAAAPRIDRATPHVTQPSAARGSGSPPMNARAQMPAPAAPRAAAPAMSPGG